MSLSTKETMAFSSNLLASFLFCCLTTLILVESANVSTAGTTCTGAVATTKQGTIADCVPTSPQVAAVYKSGSCSIFNSLSSCSPDASSTLIAPQNSGIIKVKFTNIGTPQSSGYLKARLIRTGYNDDLMAPPNETKSALRTYLVVVSNFADATVFFMDDSSRLYTLVQESGNAVKYYLNYSLYYHNANVPLPLTLDKTPQDISFRIGTFLTFLPKTDTNSIFLKENSRSTAKKLEWNFNIFMEVDMTTTTPTDIAIVGLGRDNANMTDAVISFTP